MATGSLYQYYVTKGISKKPDPDVLEAISYGRLKARLEDQFMRRESQLRRSERLEGLRMQDKALKRQAKADAISGAANLGLGAYSLGQVAWPSIKEGVVGLFGSGAGATAGAGTAGTLTTPALGSSLGSSTGLTLGTTGLTAGTAAGTAGGLTAGTTGIGAAGAETIGATGASAGSSAGASAGLGLSTGLGAAGLAAGVGLIAGKYGAQLGENKTIQSLSPWGGEKTERKMAAAGSGAAAGALAGTAILPGIGTVIGAIVGGVAGLIGEDCIIATACYGRDSKEVDITRKFRDDYMDDTTLRGYYILGERVVPIMKANARVREQMKTELVDSLIRVGGYIVGEYDTAPSEKDLATAESFLSTCRSLGESVPEYTRVNGEVV